MFALATAITSYLLLFRPAIKLLEEIVGEKTIYSGFFTSTIYIILTTLLAPGAILLLLLNNNDLIIEDMAVRLAEKYTDDE